MSASNQADLNNVLPSDIVCDDGNFNHKHEKPMMAHDYAPYEAAILKEIEDLKNESLVSRNARQIVTLDQQSVGRLSRMDAMQQQAMANATEARRQARILQLTAALERLKSGEFGYCVDCGEDIAPSRLNANPTVTKCISCQNG